MKPRTERLLALFIHLVVAAALLLLGRAAAMSPQWPLHTAEVLNGAAVLVVVFGLRHLRYINTPLR